MLEYPPAINIYKSWTKYTINQKKKESYFQPLGNNQHNTMILDRKEPNESNSHSHIPLKGIFQIVV